MARRAGSTVAQHFLCAHDAYRPMRSLLWDMSKHILDAAFRCAFTRDEWEADMRLPAERSRALVGEDPDLRAADVKTPADDDEREALQDARRDYP